MGSESIALPRGDRGHHREISLFTRGRTAAGIGGRASCMAALFENIGPDEKEGDGALGPCAALIWGQQGGAFERQGQQGRKCRDQNAP